MRKFFRKTEGFTLVELIVVIAILGILAGIGTVGYSGYMKKANEAADNQLLSALNSAFAVACIENGVDANSIADNGVSETWSGKKVTGVSLYNAEFVKYYGDGVNAEFKYFTDLEFEGGVFKGVVGDAREEKAQALKTAWGDSSYTDAKKLLSVFDVIGGYFNLPEEMLPLELDTFLPNVSGELADTLGLTDMFTGLNGAMNLSDEEMDAYLKEKYGDEYDSMDEPAKEALKKQMKANAAVMYFATDAEGRSAADVKQSVTDFMGLMKMSQNETWVNRNVSDEYLANYYRSTLTSEQQDYFDKLSASDKQQAVERFCGEQHSFGDMKLTGKEAAAMSYAAEQRGISINTGISTLGSMYALATGFYESDYYTGSDEDIPNLSEFDSVQVAMANSNFQTYLDEQGEKDLEAYLAFMSYLSTGDVEMDSTGAFLGQEGYINDAIG